MKGVGSAAQQPAMTTTVCHAILGRREELGMVTCVAGVGVGPGAEVRPSVCQSSLDLYIHIYIIVAVIIITVCSLSYTLMKRGPTHCCVPFGVRFVSLRQYSCLLFDREYISYFSPSFSLSLSRDSFACSYYHADNILYVCVTHDGLCDTTTYTLRRKYCLGDKLH